MKKINFKVVLGVIAFSATIGTTVISCEKKVITKQSSETAVVKKPGTVSATEKIEQASGTVTVLGGNCGPITCSNSAGLGGITPYNYIRISKNAYTLSHYPANMRYSIYQVSGSGSGNIYPVTRIAEFTCTENSPEYANKLLANSTTYYVYITDPSVPSPGLTFNIDITAYSPMIKFVTGNYKTGLPC